MQGMKETRRGGNVSTQSYTGCFYATLNRARVSRAGVRQDCYT